MGSACPHRCRFPYSDCKSWLGKFDGIKNTTIGNSLFELCCKNNDDGLKNSSESFEFAVRAAVEKGGGPDCCGWISSPKTSAKGVRQKVWFSASATILDGFGSGSVVVIRGYDRTNEKNAAIAMEQAKAVAESSAFAKSRFLANMSHELRGLQSMPSNWLLRF